MAAAVAAGVVLLGVAGCDDGASAAPPPSPGASTAQADDIGAAVRDAEQLLDDIDAELSADDTAGD